MSTGSVTANRCEVQTGRDGFAQVLHAEFTKFRTVRGWVIGMLVAALATVLLGLLVATGFQMSCGSGVCAGPPTGPGGEAVTDRFYFAHQPLAANGSITIRMTSLTGRYSHGFIQPGQGLTGMRPGLDPWAKAGIIIKDGTGQGSAYAAIMVTGGHGVRMQYNYTHDTAGLSGAVSAASPRWLRLTRQGDIITGYDSADGTHWTEVGTAALADLPSSAQAGVFAASPEYRQVTTQGLGSMMSTGGPALATAVLDHVTVGGAPSRAGWTGTAVGGTKGGLPVSAETFQDVDGTFTVSGSGDIAPSVPAVGTDTGTPIEQSLVGTFAGLIAVTVVAVMFITAEYRHDLIRITLAASPRRGRVLAAKAVVIGCAAFLAALIGTAMALPLGERLLRNHGFSFLPTATLTELRVVAGSAALLAVTALLALALGAVLRRSSAAITTVIALIVLPYLLATSVLPAGPADWLLRVTPAAAFAIQQTQPQYPQVGGNYSPFNGYFPLAPWTGFAVLCAWTMAALALAIVLIRRRDA